MPQLVITCHPDGSVELLLKDRVFDSRKLADSRKVERLSEVLPTDDGQQFYIRWLKGPLVTSGKDWDNAASVAGTFHSYLSTMCWPDGETIYFDSYEAAVDAEVATVNALRLKGYTFV